MINPRHPQYPTLDKDQIQAINLLHVAREAMHTAAYNDLKSAQAIYPSWLALEASLQRLWGFTEDSNYIRTWDYPHCTCPKMDNDDNYPHGYYTYSLNCPIHGQLLSKKGTGKKK